MHYGMISYMSMLLCGYMTTLNSIKNMQVTSSFNHNKYIYKMS